jgi:membrane-associated protease RseP (regulator of RpoE activity)
LKRDTPTEPAVVPSSESLPASGTTRKRPLFPETPRVHIGLFLGTLVSVTLVYLFLWGSTSATLTGAIVEAFAFTCALLAILLSHELGHYIAARKHKIDATLPYFIPAPIGIGTFGAFIQIKGQIRNRAQLMDLGAAGPLAGLVVAICVAIAGIWVSRFGPVAKAEIVFGEPLLFKALVFLLKGPKPEGMDLVLSPIAFSAWIGFLITALNLLPASQLDGGHVVYALLGRKHRVISRAVFLGLIGWGIWGEFAEMTSGPLWYFAPTAAVLSLYSIFLASRSRRKKIYRRLLVVLVVAHVGLLVYLEARTGTSVWLIWGLLLYMFGLDHPPTADERSGIDAGETIGARRTMVGILAFVVFVLTFMPLPIKVL